MDADNFVEISAICRFRRVQVSFSSSLSILFLFLLCIVGDIFASESVHFFLTCVLCWTFTLNCFLSHGFFHSEHYNRLWPHRFGHVCGSLHGSECVTLKKSFLILHRFLLCLIYFLSTGWSSAWPCAPPRNACKQRNANKWRSRVTYDCLSAGAV